MREAHTAAAAERAARRREALFDLALVAGVLLLLGLVSATAPRWSRFLRQPLQAASDEAAGEDEAGAATPTPPPGDVQRTISVKLFFPAADGGGLMLEEMTVPFSSDLARQIELVVAALVAGSRQHAPALPPETRVLGAFVTGAGVAYVNLSKEAGSGLSGGSRAELHSVYALVDTLTVNFPAVKRVQLLLDDHPAQTLAGHVDLSRPLPSDMSLLAVAEMAPLGSPDSSPGVSGGPAATPSSAASGAPAPGALP